METSDEAVAQGTARLCDGKRADDLLHAGGFLEMISDPADISGTLFHSIRAYLEPGLSDKARGPGVFSEAMMERRINTYTCETCRKMISTVDVDEGVTPFMLRCRATEGCTGMSYSSCYRPPQDRPEPTFEWYKPPRETWARYSKGMQQHFEMGGLEIRPITQRGRC